MSQALIDRWEKISKGEDRDFYILVGFYLAWFTKAELGITFLLAAESGSRDFEEFDILTRGMDARVKCERLRALAKIKKPLGPNLEARLGYFERRPIDLRNKLAHQSAGISGDGHSVYFSSLSRMPWRALGEAPFGLEAELIQSKEIFQIGLWLSFFADDLRSVFDGAVRKAVFEIETPRSSVGRAAPASPRRKAPVAKIDKRARKRERKATIERHLRTRTPKA